MVEVASPDSADLDVDIREPAVPPGDLLNRLPAEERDFSLLPMAVRLEDSSTVNTAPRLPAKIEAVIRHFSIDGKDLGFVRAAFTRVSLRAGAVIVGERSRVTREGLRISTQTRCSIDAENESRWR
jgi:hypothetical protein